MHRAAGKAEAGAAAGGADGTFLRFEQAGEEQAAAWHDGAGEIGGQLD